jgi:hypothetical protein
MNDALMSREYSLATVINFSAVFSAGYRINCAVSAGCHAFAA